MITLKEKILAFLAKNPEEAFRAEELARRLSIRNQKEIPALLQVLNELCQAGSIGRGRRKRYSYLRAAPGHRSTGIISIGRQGSATVSLLPPDAGTVIIQQRFLGTALHGDLVSVGLHAVPQSGSDAPPEGEILEVVERRHPPIVGVMEKGKHFFFVVPDNQRIGRDIYIPKGKTKGARPGDKVVARIDTWESRNLNPEGQIVEVLGKPGEVRAEMAGVARQYRLPLSFPREVMDEAESIPTSIQKEEYRRRLDLRETLCFTIDPDDAKDFDDAVSLDILADGHYRLGVHIADVSHYVREDTALDREALKRGTSVYLADGVIPMLPEKLSNDICSLRPDEDRLTYSAIMTISPRGIVGDCDIVKSVIRSKRRFAYEEVQSIIDRGRGEHHDTIKKMHRLSQILLKKRMSEGSIDFESVETKFRYDEHGKPTEIIRKMRLDAHRLVEEFMLMANQIVAKHIAHPRTPGDHKPFIYRVHDLPDPDKLKDLASFVEHLGHRLNLHGGVTSKALQKLLAEVHGTEEENVINEVAIRAMAKAIYSERNIGHFGLGFRHYTHFTSPIRRYPDLVVHRLLIEYTKKLTAGRRERIIANLPPICQQSSAMERNAMDAERDSVKVMRVEYMKRHVGDEFHAIISGVTNFGMFVEITDLLVEGLIRLRDMEDDYYVYDEKKYSLIGRRTKKRYRLGDKVVVKVVRVDPEEREIDFVLVEPGEKSR